MHFDAFGELQGLPSLRLAVQTPTYDRIIIPHLTQKARGAIAPLRNKKDKFFQLISIFFLYAQKTISYALSAVLFLKSVL